MIISPDEYYSHPAVSNSTLTAVKKLLVPGLPIDASKAFRFGTLVDAILTERDKINFLNLTIGEHAYSRDEFDLARAMAANFLQDDLCKLIHQHSEKQYITYKPDFLVNYLGFEFRIPIRAKWDFLAKAWNMGADLKTTGAKSQPEFEESIQAFDYDRQGALYMDSEEIDKFIFLAISKVNKKLFKVPIVRGSGLYYSGLAKYQELAFNYNTLFQNF